MQDVLIIENDPKSIDDIRNILEPSGITVHSAQSAESGFSMAISLVPKAILVNLAAPGSNGLEICKKIHAEPTLKSIPIVLITLREGKYDPVYRKLYGIIGFLKKPFSEEALSSVMKNYLPIGGEPQEEISLEQPVESPMEDFIVVGEQDTEGQQPQEEQLSVVDDFLFQEKEATEAPQESVLDDQLFIKDDADTNLYEIFSEEQPKPIEETGTNMPLIDETDDSLLEASSPELIEEQPTDEPFSEILHEETGDDKISITPEPQSASQDEPQVKSETVQKQSKPKTSLKMILITLGAGIILIGGFLGYFFLYSTKTADIGSLMSEKKVLPPEAESGKTSTDTTIAPDLKSEFEAGKPATSPFNATVESALANATAIAAPPAPEPKPEAKPEPSPKKEPAPKPPVAEAKEPSTAPAPKTQSYAYHVQFGVFKSRANADSLSASLKSAAVENETIEQKNQSGAIIYRVLLKEGFASKKAAQSKANAVSAKSGYDTSVYIAK